MSQVITLSIKNGEALKIIKTLKDRHENISEIVCNLLVKEYKA